MPGYAQNESLPSRRNPTILIWAFRRRAGDHAKTHYDLSPTPGRFQDLRKQADELETEYNASQSRLVPRVNSHVFSVATASTG